MENNQSAYEEFKGSMANLEAVRALIEKGRNLRPEEVFPLVESYVPDAEKQDVARAIAEDYDQGLDLTRVYGVLFESFSNENTKKAKDLAENSLEKIVQTAPSENFERVIYSISPEKSSIKSYKDIVKTHADVSKLRRMLELYEAGSDNEKKVSIEEMKKWTANYYENLYKNDKDIKEMLVNLAKVSSNLARIKVGGAYQEKDKIFRQGIAGDEGKYVNSIATDNKFKFSIANALISEPEEQRQRAA